MEFMVERIEVGMNCVTDDEMEFFIVTNSDAHPIVCLAENNGFPPVKDYYARYRNFQGKDGVHVLIRFEEEPDDNGVLAINLVQQGMNPEPATKKYTIIPC